MRASSLGHQQLVSTLLEAGADPNLQENKGWTALMLAYIRGHYKVADELINYGARTDIFDDNGMTARDHKIAFEKKPKSTPTLS